MPFLDSVSKRLELWKHIRQHGLENEIHVDFVGGWIDHCHCLVSLKSNQSPEFVMKMLKGESSRFVNRDHLGAEGFGWQDGYYAAAVQFDRINQVREYIKNQESHHGKQSFTDEYEALLLKSGFQKVGDLDFG